MAKTIKGLTVEIGGDTTKLGDALENVNKKSKSLSSELGNINRLLKMDPGNADLLAQKQKVLAEAVENTGKKLETLKEAERQVQEQFERGEVSAEQVRELQREIIATTKKLESYEGAIKETSEAVQDLSKNSEEAKQTLSDFADKGLAGIGAAVGAAVTGLVAAAEASREYRTEMGKLNTAFTESGFSSEAATGAYTELVGVLGETDQAVETANHLAKLVDNEKDLATWTGDILPGVFATFGDSLPIEGLTEAANETAKVGQVTGPLADALNWAGINEDKFNESLAKCNTEQERQALITETLTGLYGEASAAYKEQNEDVIAANLANEAWAASMAELGAAVEPLITEVKTMAAALLSDLVPVITQLLDNLPIVAVVVGGLTAALVAFKISALGGLSAAIAPVIASFKSLFAVMLANPIGLIIVAITGLVAGFMYLWKNSESFRNFWIKLWEAIKNAASKAVDFLKGLPAKISSAIAGAVTRVTTWGSNMASKIKAAATSMLNGVYNTLKNLPSRVYNAIVGAVSRVATWGSNMSSKAKSAMSNVVSAVTNTLKALPGKVLSIGGDLVAGLWNGVSNKLSWLKSKLSGFASSVLDGIKGFFGVHSPSTETAWIGDMLDRGLAEGMLDNISTPVKAMQRVAGGVIDAASDSVNGLTLGRQLQNTYASPTSGAGNGTNVAGMLEKILAAIEHGQVLTIDGEQFVGATAARYDARLGQRRLLAARGAL